MSYQRYQSSLGLAIVAVMPIEFGTPGAVWRQLIVGETACCATSRNAANRESPAFSPSSWLPQVSTSPPMLQMRAGEFGGPQRSLYVRFARFSMWKYSAGGLPVERHTSLTVSPGGSGNRLSIWFTPPCSTPSKSPMFEAPAPLSIVTSSISTAPQ